jgi:hypothetical protein
LKQLAIREISDYGPIIDPNNTKLIVNLEHIYNNINIIMTLIVNNRKGTKIKKINRMGTLRNPTSSNSSWSTGKTLKKIYNLAELKTIRD